MRNRTTHRRKYHHPAQEWSKIVRFNGRDYPMNAVYDRDPGMDLDDEVYNNEHELDPSPEDLETGISLDELPWMRQVSRIGHRTLKIDESFFDDFAEEIFQEQNKKTAAQVLAERAPYPMTDENGNDFDVRMSEDRIKNSIFYLISNVVIVESGDGFDSIDDFLVTGGKVNDINSYKMMISGIVYRYSQFYFIADRSSHGGSKYLQIYFTTEKDAILRIYYPGISLRRPKDQIVMNYDKFREIISIDTNIGRRKEVDDYLNGLMSSYINQAVNMNVSVTLLENAGRPRPSWFSNGVITDMKLLTGNFRTLEKFSQKSKGNISVVKNAMNEDMEYIRSEYEGEPIGSMLTDRYWVLVGGYEGYMQGLLGSIWAERNKKSDVFDGNFAQFRFYTPNKDIPLKKDEHNAILVPLSIFANALQGLIIFGMKDSEEL